MLRCSLGLDDDEGEALGLGFLEHCDDDVVERTLDLVHRYLIHFCGAAGVTLMVAEIEI